MKKCLILCLSLMLLFLTGCRDANVNSIENVENAWKGMKNFNTLTFLAVEQQYEQYREEKAIGKKIDAFFTNYLDEENPGFSEIGEGRDTKEEFLESTFTEAYVSGVLRDTSFLAFLAQYDLKYHFQWAASTVMTTYGATSNVSYNISYILNLPAKLKYNYIFNKKFVAGEIESDSLRDYSEIITKYSNTSFWLLMVYDLFYAITGLGLAFCMIFAGGFVGLLTHPFATFLKIPAEVINIIDGIKTAFHVFA